MSATLTPPLVGIHPLMHACCVLLDGSDCPERVNTLHL
jgi:hypothetical protein